MEFTTLSKIVPSFPNMPAESACPFPMSEHRNRIFVVPTEVVMALCPCCESLTIPHATSIKVVERYVRVCADESSCASSESRHSSCASSESVLDLSGGSNTPHSLLFTHTFSFYIL